MIVQYYADSLGLSRPGYVGLDERYIHLFENWLREHFGEPVFLINRSRRGLTVDKLLEIFKEDEEYIVGFKDILIIHEGVCDCAPRPVSKRLRAFISKLPAFLRIRIVSYLHNNRAKILARGSVHYLVDKKEFEANWMEWMSSAIKNFKRIYIFLIAPTNATTEAHSPGFSRSIVMYNEIIRKVVKSINNPAIEIIDVYDLLSKSNDINEWIIEEDGHHITAKAHELYFEELKRREIQKI